MTEHRQPVVVGSAADAAAGAATGAATGAASAADAAAAQHPAATTRRALVLASLFSSVGLQAACACRTGPAVQAAPGAPLQTPPQAPQQAPLPAALQEGQHPHAVQLPGQAQPLRLWLYLPPGYHAAAARGTRWPLVVFLHGSGQRGQRLDDVLVHGPPQRVAQGTAYPFVLCSPQLEAGRWNVAVLHQLLPVLAQQLRVDLQRVTATGLSLGGHGVWEWAASHPGDLAGIAPVCGFGDPAAVCQGRSVPVRAYHGDNDPVVPLARQQACVQALLACGGTASLTVYPGVGHEAWTPAYQDPGLVPWLMAQRVSVPTAAAAATVAASPGCRHSATA